MLMRWGASASALHDFYSMYTANYKILKAQSEASSDPRIREIFASGEPLGSREFNRWVRDVLKVIGFSMGPAASAVLTVFSILGEGRVVNNGDFVRAEHARKVAEAGGADSGFVPANTYGGIVVLDAWTIRYTQLGIEARVNALYHETLHATGYANGNHCAIYQRANAMTDYVAAGTATACGN